VSVLPDAIDCRTEPLDADAALVAVTGEVTFSNVGLLDRTLEAALTRARRLLIDLSEVAFIDSSGLSALLTASAEAGRSGGSVALVIPAGEPPSIFRFRGVDRLLDLHTDREAAIAALRSTRL
jgi:anti-sigma B factor antagonist